LEKREIIMFNKIRWVAPVLICGGTWACGSDSEQSDRAGVPAPIADHPACVISADCPASSHCDLGECFQECNTQKSCDGELSCSPRARCLVDKTPDHDPAPSAEYAGALSVTPTVVQLTDADSKLVIDLLSSSAEPVRYRVSLAAPHLSISEPRGEFTGKTQIEIDVDPHAATALDEPGTVKVITTLGDVVVDAPIHHGLSGRYQGSLAYDGGAVALGAARIVLDVIEQNGDVSARIDPKASLLFPGTAAGDATGHGTFDGNNVSLTLAQRVEAEFGGTRNRFARDLGRRVTFSVAPASGGRLEGTFK
jgi:hypothetical protein